jgi:hypothetical protein
MCIEIGRNRLLRDVGTYLPTKLPAARHKRPSSSVLLGLLDARGSSKLDDDLYYPCSDVRGQEYETT